MRTPHTYRHNGEKHTIDLEQVYYALAQRQTCTIVFKNGTAEDYPYPLCDFEKLLAGKGYGRVSFSCLVFFEAIADYICPNAILDNGQKLPVTRKYYTAVEIHLQEKRMRGSSEAPESNK